MAKKNRSTTCIWILLGIGALFLNGCSSSQHKRGSSHSRKSSTDSSVAIPNEGNLKRATAQETSEYHEIEDLYSKNFFESAESKMNSFARRFPRSSLLPSIENLRGLMLLRQKKANQAIIHFRKAIRLSSANDRFIQYVLYNLASAQFELGQVDEAQHSLNEIHISSLDTGNRLKVYILKANIYQKKSLPLEACRQLLTAGHLLSEMGTQDSRKTYYKILDQSLQTISDIGSLETLYQEYEESPVADSLLFRLGSQEMAVGIRGNGEIHLKRLVQKYPESPYYLQANELLTSLQDQIPVDKHTIGVLLPLKGKFSKFGIKTLQGIQLAFGIFDSREPDYKINLVVEDSGEEIDQAIQALNRLALKHHVAAIIGPMLSKGVDQISQRAQELGVPLISLSRRASSVQDYVFQSGLTQQLQAYEIARYAIQQLGAKRFAVVYPNEKYGLEMSQSFWDAVESLGGKMVGVETYNPGETDFRQVVDKLSGLYYSDARQRELDLLAQEREANHITKRTRKTEQFFHLRPIVDYDAVFIPDEPKVAGQILPTFAYRDVEHVKFLGTSAWNSPDFINRVQSYGEHATFVDAFFLEAKSPASRIFAEKFKTVFGQEPTPFEALAYDAGSLVRTILTSSSGNLSRSDLRDKLKSVENFQGVTGNISYKDGQFFRDLRVLTVRNGHFTEIPHSTSNN